MKFELLVDSIIFNLLKFTNYKAEETLWLERYEIRCVKWTSEKNVRNAYHKIYLG